MPSYKLRRYGTVKPLKNWYAFYSEGRRSKSWSTGTPDKGLADKRAAAFMRELFVEKDASPGQVLIEAVLRRYFDDKRDEVESAETARRTVDHLVAYYEGENVDFITAATSKDYEAARRKAGWANGTINRTRNTLRAALKHAVKDGKLRYAPFVPTLKVARGKERWLTDAEAKRLYRSVLPKRWRYLNLFIRIAISTGARHRAILSLTWDRVDMEKGRIDFREPGKPETKKRRPNAPINDKLLRLLRAAHKMAEGDFVIEHRGGPLKSIKKAFGEACVRAKLSGVTPHTLKHTYITWLLRQNVPIWQVAGLTNTSPATIAKVYGHHAQDDLKAAANAVFGRSAEKVPNSQEKGL